MEGKKEEQLQDAFLKSVDTAISLTINKTDFNEFLGEGERMGVERAFIAAISKAESQMSESFIHIKKEKVLQYETNRKSQPISSPKVVSVDDLTAKLQQDATNVVNALKKHEIDELRQAIRAMELEIKKLRDASGRLRTQLFNEVEALNEENVKIQRAVGVGRPRESYI